MKDLRRSPHWILISRFNQGFFDKHQGRNPPNMTFWKEDEIRAYNHGQLTAARKQINRLVDQCFDGLPPKKTGSQSD